MYIVTAQAEDRAAPTRRQSLLVLIAETNVEDAQAVALECMIDAGWEEIEVQEVGLAAAPTAAHPRLDDAWAAAARQGAAIVVV